MSKRLKWSEFTPWRLCRLNGEHVKPERTAGFQNFRMRASDVRGYRPRHKKSFFHGFGILLNFIVEGCALKFSHSPVRSGFENFCPLPVIKDTAPARRRHRRVES